MPDVSISGVTAVTHPLLQKFRAARVIPVIRTTDTALAVLAVEWLREAGLSIFEITMTVPGAVDLIRDLSCDPALIVGAGTVPDRATAQACLDAGAGFLVSPWIDPDIADACRAKGAACMLGAMTPTEVRAGLAAGADVIKIFPASSAGGPGHIKALRSVFPDIAFCPTGGVDAHSAPAYLAAGAAFVGIGGKLVDEAALARGDRAAIGAAARDVLGLRQA